LAVGVFEIWFDRHSDALSNLDFAAPPKPAAPAAPAPPLRVGAVRQILQHLPHLAAPHL
jgi:hypothetical protein